MTTKNSPLSILQTQADKIASTLKAAERGEKIDVRFAEKIKEARDNATFKVGIVMDDKAIIIDIPWTTIKDMNQIDLSKYILNQMRESQDPDYSREGIFVLHNCWRCNHGKKACVMGNPRQCEYLLARND